MKAKINFRRLSKKQKICRTLKYGVLIMFILCALTLCIEALLPGSVSGQHSSDVGDMVDVPVDKVIEPVALKLSALDEELTSNVYVGQSISLTPVFIPQNTTNMQVSWSVSDNKIATVQNDIVTFCTVGEVTVTVTSNYNNNLSDSFVFNVIEMPVESISIKAPDNFFVGQSKYLAAEILPQNATNKDYTLHSSDPDCISVEGDTITAIKEGEAQITATSSFDNSIKCVINVKASAIPATSIIFKVDDAHKSDEIKLEQEQRITVSVEILPSDATYKELIWDISDGLNVDFLTASKFTVSAAEAGKYSIKVSHKKYPSVCSTLTFNVTPIKAADIKYDITVQKKPVYGNKIIAYLGDDIKINAYPLPNNALGSIEYAVDKKGLDIEPNGTVNASKIGNYTVTISCDDIIKTVEFEIREVKVTGLQILLRGQPIYGGLQISVNEKTALSYKLLTDPSDRYPINNAVTWSSSENSYATVSEGTVRGIARGESIISCTHIASGMQASITLTVSGEDNNNITDVWLELDDKKYDGSSQTEIASLKTGKQYNIAFFARTQDGQTISQGLSYSLSESCVSIKADKLTALKSGTTTLTLVGGAIKKQFTLEVTDVATEKIELPSEKSVHYKDVFSISATLIGENGEAPTNNDISYEYDKNFFSLSGNSFSASNPGKFTALKLGKTTITVCASGIKSAVLVNIINNISGIEAPKQELYVGSRTPVDFSPVITNDAAPYPVKYSFEVEEGTDIISVNSVGIIKALKEGVAKLKIRAEGTDAETVVEINAVDRLIDSIKITPPKDPKIGQSFKLDLTYSPADASAKRILYSVSDKSIANISSDGVLKILKAGTFTLTATAEKGDGKSSVNITAYNVLQISDIKTKNFTFFSGFDDSGNAQGKLKKNSSARFDFIFAKDATYRKIDLTSSDPDIISITGNTITANKVGNATITITYHDGSDQEKMIFTVNVEVLKQKLSDVATNWGYKIRKSLGHYGAFLVMGIFAILTFILFIKNRYLASILTFVSGFGIAGLTELLQMITPNRGPSFADVLLDFQGFCTSTVPILIGFIIAWTVAFAKNKKIKRANIEADEHLDDKE